MNIGYRIAKPIRDYKEYIKAAKWCNINNAVIEDKWEYYEVVEIPIIEKSLDELKEEKFKELKAAFQNTRKTAHCMCALGFEVDANEDANTNIVGLITVMKEGETTMFRAYDNSFHEVSREDLITIRDNIIKNSQFLYQMKWGMESRINNAVSEEELNSLVWNY